MKKLSVAFLWHMHQPFYKDSLNDIYSLPWVRLHSLKGYYDMPSILQDYPDIKATFNLVPSLLYQINEYNTKKANDIFLTKTLIPATDLGEDDKKFIIKNFFMANWDNMIHTSPRYWHILTCRGFEKIKENQWKDIIHRFSVQDLRDLQVWFNLCWFGYRAKQKYPEIKEFIKKDKHFTEDDKHKIIEIQYKVMSEIIPLYKKLAKSGQIELTTSPYYHPILPLVLNTDFAKRAMPDSQLPDKFSFPEDVLMQIQNGIEYFKKNFGFCPQGMWPSEGAVCPELIPYLKNSGIKWIATDEDILYKSIVIHNDEKCNMLFKPYSAEYNGNSINILFRDRGLSDLIGFTYCKNPPDKSCNDLLSHFENILKHTTLQNPLVNIILDGENAWESYPDGGEKFFNILYERLSVSKEYTTVRISDYLIDNPPTSIIQNLHSGSWINHNYKVWIGGREENQAWNLLRKTRIFFDKYVRDHDDLPKNIKNAIFDELFISEGSDWFWWYGEIFSSDTDEEFDRLFRMHLANVYRILGLEIPLYLKQPIFHKEEIVVTSMPVGFINPIIDGVQTHFYEWQEAGYYNIHSLCATMHKTESFLSGIYFGFDPTNLYIRLDPIKKNGILIDANNIFINIHLDHNNQQYIIEFPFKSDISLNYTISFIKDENQTIKICDSSNVKFLKIIELAVPFNLVNLLPDQQVNLYVLIKQESLEIERYPKNGYISFTVPGDEFESTMWSV